MNESAYTRRDALKNAATAATLLLTQGIAHSEDAQLQIAGKPIELAITSISADTLRITAYALDNGKLVQPQPDGALVKEDWGKPAITLRSLPAPRTVKVGVFNVKLSADPLTIRVENAAGHVVQELKTDPVAGKVTFPVGDAPILGMGQGGPQFDRRGSVQTMRSGQVENLGTQGARVPIQMLIGTGGWAMYMHQPVGAFDLSGKDGQLQPARPEVALPLDIFVIASKTPPAVLSEYARITGHPEMAPLWSFGYQQSHRTLGTPEEILQEAKTFREKKLPCDAMIYLGTDFCPNGWNTHNGEFTWNQKVFPDPAKAIKDLHDEHMKVILHIVVEGRHYSGTVNDPCTAEPIPAGRTPDGRWPNDRQVSCYWPAHKPLLDLGVDGWWPDQGDGFDPPSRLARIRMYFEGHQKYRPNERVYALHRNGYAGMQRFAAFLWSGDIQSTWRTLATHVPVAVNTGLSGVPYWGTDIGGFVPTSQFTGELYARWFQFAAFNPLFRSHGRVWTLHSPMGWNQGAPQPPVSQETRFTIPDAEYHNAAIEPVCKKYLELRYRLMPYLYSAVKETCETGIPIVRAMWLHYPDDPIAVARGDQYLWGRDMLVAPVVEQGATSRKLYLPKGDWWDFWTSEKIAGGREIEKKVDLATMPLYVRAGGIIPGGPVKQYTAEPSDAPLDLYVHPGADGAFSWYEDDGATFDFRKGAFMRVNIAWNNAQRRLTMRLAAGSKMLPPARRKITVRLSGETVTRDLVFDGRPVDIKV